MCSQCFVVRPLTEFSLHTRQSSVNICKSCNYLKVPPVDKSIYKAILRTIRRDERRYSFMVLSFFLSYYYLQFQKRITSVLCFCHTRRRHQTHFGKYMAWTFDIKSARNQNISKVITYDNI